MSDTDSGCLVDRKRHIIYIRSYNIDIVEIKLYVHSVVFLNANFDNKNIIHNRGEMFKVDDDGKKSRYTYFSFCGKKNGVLVHNLIFEECFIIYI